VVRATVHNVGGSGGAPVFITTTTLGRHCTFVWSRPDLETRPSVNACTLLYVLP
jgi:hypothetical protein